MCWPTASAIIQLRVGFHITCAIRPALDLSTPTAYCCRLTIIQQTWRKFLQLCTKFLRTGCKFVQNCQKIGHIREFCANLELHDDWDVSKGHFYAIIILLAGKVAVSELAMRASSHPATLFFDDEPPQRIVCVGGDTNM